ncbi:MAG: diguanylate cyclase [Lamprobacter sp.]|uniref:diguanylate cyclase n=1 Tax=Lamprobacter sp. TaxID=3100796 RepID=UPI002B262117|nr:diguanylate cyclase [Lamprobacter sp.]MEA3642287.1 diguanylate cyclase [Lamprobacter sp.]
MSGHHQPSRSELIRLLAEAEAALNSDDSDATQQLLHDLQLHQIELEIQNRDLRQAQAELEDSHHRYAELYDFAPVGYLTLDHNGLIRSLNLTAAKLLGRERSSLLDHPLSSFLVNGNSALLFAHLRAVFAELEETSITTEIKLQSTAAGPSRRLRFDSRAHRSADGESRCLTTLIDITEMRQAEDERDEVRQRLNLAVEGGDIGTYSAALPAGRVHGDERFYDMLGYRPGDLKLNWSDWLAMVHPDDRERVVARLRPVLEAELDRFESEYRVRHRVGHWVWILDRARVFARDPALGGLELAGTHFEVTRRREAELKLAHLADHDELTGLLNRRGMWRAIERIRSQATRADMPYCLAILDLDHFKLVNDAYGHAAGDEVLRVVAGRLHRGLRQGDWIGRWGGEEMIALIPDTTVAQAVQSIERMRVSVSAEPIMTDSGEIQVTLSAGLACSRAANDDPSEMIARADAALYRAKDAGRNRVVFDGNEAGQRAISIAVQLQDALRLTAIRPAFQPIVALSDQQLVGEEALARIIDPEHGNLAAGAFLSVAQQLGLMHKIDALLLDTVIERLQTAAPALDPALLSFVNLSGDLLLHPQEISRLADALSRLSALLGRAPPVVLTIAEEQVATSTAQVAKALAPLLELGCQLALGRCGGEAGGFRFLAALPIKFVELDAGLVRQARESARARTVLSSLQHAAQDMGLITLVKRIESEETREQLLELGVDWGQGYLLGRPAEPMLD